MSFSCCESTLYFIAATAAVVVVAGLHLGRIAAWWKPTSLQWMPLKQRQRPRFVDGYRVARFLALSNCIDIHLHDASSTHCEHRCRSETLCHRSNKPHGSTAAYFPSLAESCDRAPLPSSEHARSVHLPPLRLSGGFVPLAIYFQPPAVLVWPPDWAALVSGKSRKSGAGQRLTESASHSEERPWPWAL